MGYDGHNKVKGIKLSVLVDLQGLPLLLLFLQKNDSTLYIPTLKNFKIKRPVGRPVNRPSKVTADGMYDTAKIRKYNRKRERKFNIPVNKRNQRKKKRGRPINLLSAGRH
ncbi:MAG: transposase [Methanosarcina sp.]